QKLYLTVPIEFKLGTLSLEEDLEQYYYEEIEADFLDTFPAVKKIEEQPNEEMIFKVVEDIPAHPECEHLKDSLNEMKYCTEQKILAFIYSKFQYPPEAIANKTEGEILLKFYVDREGNVSKVEILKDIGNGCGEEAKRALLLMNKEKPWRRASARGKVVKVQFIMPVVFKLNKEYGQKN
ncbi:MAG: energy transducer TonB, partial [Saprospiraceae bacterium]